MASYRRDAREWVLRLVAKGQQAAAHLHGSEFHKTKAARHVGGLVTHDAGARRRVKNRKGGIKLPRHRKPRSRRGVICWPRRACSTPGSMQARAAVSYHSFIGLRR